MLRISKLICSLILVIYSHTSFAQKDINIVVIDYPPLMGPNGGFLQDIVKEAFKLSNIEIKFKVFPISRVYWAVTESDDVAFLGSRKWPRGKYQKQVHPLKISVANLHFYYLKEKFPKGISFKNLNEMSKYSIGYVRGGALTKIFENAGIKPTFVTDLKQSVDMVHKDRIDMFAATELGGSGAIRKNYPELFTKFEKSKDVIYRIEGDIVFSQKHLNYLKIFEDNFAEIKKNGTYLKIMKRYYKDSDIPKSIIDFINS